MKFTLASPSTLALLMLVISHGTESASMVKRDVPAEIEKITKYLQDLSSMLTTTTAELVEKIKAADLTSQAEAYLQEGKAQVQPLLEKVQAQLKPLTANIDEKLKPLSGPILSQIQPLAASVEAQVEDLLRKVMDHTKALLPPQ
ncbi:type-4 ice-structuring protein LS-12-like [Alosa sapidissima]|uniref:type-4 ice-structuring protein LS-12-like n=1 Tax=Alosa sapidissima TaxID=34773 RepID=UPI001C09EBCE|nr:type-4 ice-structuring protein LS-12-like [Alosa sapidissima]